MARVFKLRRGLKAALPTLAEGEPGWVLDEERLYIGTDSGNVALPNSTDVANKADGSSYDYHKLTGGKEITAGQDLDLLSNGICWSVAGTVTGTLLNRPPNLINASCIIITESGNGEAQTIPGQFRIQTIHGRYNNQVFRRFSGEPASGKESWGTWVQFATNMPPTWYNLTPSNDWTVGSAGLRYCKDGGGTVFLTGAVRKSSALISGETLMVLPEGFRPVNYIGFVVAQLSGTTGAAWTTTCVVDTYGVVRFFEGTAPPNFSAAKDLVINVSFPAAN
ncbi:MAG: hypothetical protein ACK5L0_04915 [Candidatus Fimivivens sp.]